MFKAGVCKIDITPPVGYILQGHSARNKPSEKVHDPLYLKVLSIFNGNKRIIIVTSDLVGFYRNFIEDTRTLVEERTGIAKENLFLTASHTHTGPVMEDSLYRVEKPLPDYLSLLQKKIVGGIIEAMNDEEEVGLSWGKGDVDIGIVNRRKKTSEGVFMMPNPEGPIDTEVNVLKIDKIGGIPKAILFNYSCHPTTLSPQIFQISADYPGVAQRELEKIYPRAIALFTNGCCGDVRPAVIEEDKFKGGNFEDVERLGKILSKEVIRCCNAAEEVKGTIVTGILKKVAFPFDSDWLTANEKIPKKVCHIYNDENMKEVIEEWRKYWLEKLKEGKTIPHFVEGDIQVIKLGEVRLLGLPGEIMVEIGLKIKEKMPDKLVICGYCNGNLGYLPTSQMLKEGGYEVGSFIYRYPAPFSQQVENILINNTMEILKE